LNSRPCRTNGRICSTHSSGIRSTRFRPSTESQRPNGMSFSIDTPTVGFSAAPVRQCE
jgi:hypothetical protein